MTELLSRRELDRQGVLDNERTAHTAKMDASAFEAIAAHITENPDYGQYADRAANVVRRAYIQMVMGLLDISLDAQAVADDFRSHLDVA